MNVSARSDPDGGRKKLPEETFRDRTGDCEDFALLLCYFANELGENMKLVTVKGENGYHAIVRLNGKYYEPQIFNMFYTGSEFNVLKVYTYEEAYYLDSLR